MPKNKNKNTGSEHQVAQDMFNNLVNTNIPTSNPNTHSPSGSSSRSRSQPTGFTHFVPLATNPYSQTFNQQHPQQAFYQIPQHQIPQQQIPQQQIPQQHHSSQPIPYYTNLLHEHSSTPFQQMQQEIQDSSDEADENNNGDEAVPETQPDDETQNEDETQPDPKGKRKQVRWTEEETRILCERWIHCSENGVIGRGQTHKSFWKNVVQAYNSCMAEKRNYSQLNGKWNKIAPDVKKFNAIHKCYTEVRPQSGATDTDVLTATREHFAQQEEGRKFIYEACWNILKLYPKFFQEKGVMGNKRNFACHSQPIDLDAETGTNVQPGVSNLELNMEHLFRPDPLRRPPGRKAQKKSSSSDAATSSSCASTEKSDAYVEVRRSALAHTEAIHTIKENATKKLAFKALKFLSFQKKKTKKEKDLIRNARANVVEEYEKMFPPSETDPNDEDENEADDEESGSE